MELLRSEVKLLLIRNKQLEQQNETLTRCEQQLSKQLLHQKDMLDILESMKCSQNEYIDLLNDLLIMLTVDNDDYDQSNDSERQYNSTKQAINHCVDKCQRLQHKYELCKLSINANMNHRSLNQMYSNSVTTANKCNLFARLEQKLYPSARPSTDDNCDQHINRMNDVNDVHFELQPQHQHEEVHDVDEQLEEEEEEDSDPNGAGEQYLDITDKEFLPKGNITAKTARKSLTISTTPRITKSRKGFKSSQKVGDKFRCIWKGCVFMSSYKQNVERHYRVHTGEKPFKCTFKGCNFSASQAGNLKVHQERHGHVGHVSHSPHSPINANSAQTPHKIKVKEKDKEKDAPNTTNTTNTTSPNKSPIKQSK